MDSDKPWTAICRIADDCGRLQTVAWESEPCATHSGKICHMRWNYTAAWTSCPENSVLEAEEGNCIICSPCESLQFTLLHLLQAAVFSVHVCFLYCWVVLHLSRVKILLLSPITAHCIHKNTHVFASIAKEGHCESKRKEAYNISWQSACLTMPKHLQRGNVAVQPPRNANLDNYGKLT